MNIQGWFPLGLTGLISLLSKGLSRVFSSALVQRHQFFSTQPSICSNSYQIRSDQISHSVVSDSLRPQRLQHVRPPCPSPTPGACSNSCHWDGDAIQSSHPLPSPSPPALNLSQHHSLFKWVSSSHQVAKVLELQLQNQSFQWTTRTDLPPRMDWLDLLAVQGTLKSLLQHHSSKASILQHSAFFIV